MRGQGPHEGARLFGCGLCAYEVGLYVCVVARLRRFEGWIARRQFFERSLPQQCAAVGQGAKARGEEAAARKCSAKGIDNLFSHAQPPAGAPTPARCRGALNHRLLSGPMALPLFNQPVCSEVRPWHLRTTQQNICRRRSNTASRSRGRDRLRDYNRAM